MGKISKGAKSSPLSRLYIFVRNSFCLIIMSAANTQVHFRLDIIMEANTMNPDQTDLGPIVFAV